MSVQAIAGNIRQHSVRWFFGAVVCAVLGYGLWTARRFQSDPALPTLPFRTGADWIILDAPLALGVHNAGSVIVVFRAFVNVQNSSDAGQLTFCSARRANVIINGKFAYEAPENVASWKRVVELAPANLLVEGRNEIKVEVENINGPPALWLEWKGVGLKSDVHWEGSRDLSHWRPVRLAAKHPLHSLAKEFQSPLDALRSNAVTLVVIFTLGAAGGTWLARKSDRLKPNMTRFSIMAIWFAVGFNNIMRMPHTPGFDSKAHIEVIIYILNYQRLPLANEGWQMFQSPLYYLIGAPFLSIMAKLFSADVSLHLLRALSLLCGIVQIELSFRIVRRIFPSRNDLQILATLVAAALPINTYMSHYVGNEPLAGVFIAALFLACLRLAAPYPDQKPNLKPVVAVGVLFGLAMLTKVSALLMGPVIVATIVYVALARTTSLPAALGVSVKMATSIFGISVAIAGWYYFRNWIHFGRPFVSGWDFNRGFSWWQDPGFRALQDYTTFGRALTYPIYSSTDGFWNGLYSSFWSDSYLGAIIEEPHAPPWNYGFLAASLLLALIPSVLMVTGFVRFSAASLVSNSIIGALIVLTLTLYGLSLVQYSLLLPYFGALKASYTLGAVPIFVLLAASGLELIGRAPWPLRAAVHGGLACWAFTALATYVVVS